MKVTFHKKFTKNYQKLPMKIKESVNSRMMLFSINPTSSILRIHKLKGGLKDRFSMNVGGDMRIQYRYVTKHEVMLTNIGTHSELYE